MGAGGIGALGIALGLGLLVGLQREWAEKKVAGVRTFALITVLGALCGLIATGTDAGWTIAAGLLAVGAMFWVARSRQRGGITTEICGLVMYAVGVTVALGHELAGVVTGGVVAVLLHTKGPLHHLAGRLGASGFRAIVRLVVIAMVVLPVLPDESYGPYAVLNPFEIWLMVVLIVGISTVAWAVQRLLGAQSGTLVAGVLGGLVSSTATTVSFTRRARDGRMPEPAAAAVLVVASTVVFARVLLEVGVTAPSLLPVIAPPLLAMAALMVVLSAIAVLCARPKAEAASGEPPSDLGAAVVFGALYAAVLFAVAAAKQHFGDDAMYYVAGLSGLTDVDAITLSTARLMRDGTVGTGQGWRLILVGVLANLVFKGGAIALLGSRRLFGRVAVPFGLSLAGGAAILAWWPA